MGTVSLRIDDDLLEEANRTAKALHMSRAEYVRKAIIEMNEKITEELKRQRIQQASRKVREESMKINREFAAFEGEPDA
jgi:predicted transcriptional regulator